MEAHTFAFTYIDGPEKSKHFLFSKTSISKHTLALSDHPHN